jgi:hypothetical protein
MYFKSSYFAQLLTTAIVESVLPVTFRQSSHVKVRKKPECGPDQKLEAANDKQPDTRFLQRRVKEEHTAHQKPDCYEEVVQDAEHFIASPDYQLLIANGQSEWVIGVLIVAHFQTCDLNQSS